MKKSYEIADAEDSRALAERRFVVDA